MPLAFTLDGRRVEVDDDGSSLLEVLRDRLHARSAKDGCSPQGQCGCCTVLVDGQPRVACVTPARRVEGRTVTTLDGLDEADRERWADGFLACGASQCGFCTPGIIVRLNALGPQPSRDRVEQALLAHLCRCTGWQTIVDAATGSVEHTAVEHTAADRDLDAAASRATIEGGTPQVVSRDVVLGRAGFADDTAPRDSLVAVPSATAPGEWVVAETLADARRLAGKVQGRRTTIPPTPPLALPPGDWDVRLRTTWVEPGYLEPDASWCEPGGDPFTPLANGGAFGGKVRSVAPDAARRLADDHGRPVRVVLAREDVVRLGPKRPPIAAGLRRDGTGIIRVVRTHGIAEAIHAVLPDVEVEEVDVAGPPTSTDLRAAGWAEAAILRAALDADPSIAAPNGSSASAVVDAGGTVRIAVRCGRPLDTTVLRSYCIGAAHMALGWVRSEGIAVDADGGIHDLTIRSFGILRAKDTPRIVVDIDDADGSEPVNGSDAVFVAVAAAAWKAAGYPPDWPIEKGRA
ncbi:MAG TPA: 2Fe-2S iron-sulfur cluster-binding protein [Acidimicrobiales bacterium]|nr:2Fe-2S iron-sulfur cluster-binding protein [Acidimicrobiales bacterium]